MTRVEKHVLKICVMLHFCPDFTFLGNVLIIFTHVKGKTVFKMISSPAPYASNCSK